MVGVLIVLDPYVDLLEESTAYIFDANKKDHHGIDGSFEERSVCNPATVPRAVADVSKAFVFFVTFQ